MKNGFDERPDLSLSSVSFQNHGLELSPRQAEIYRNLEAIGPEIAAFYLDGIRILQNEDLETAANLLAHIAREVEGSLRDVLSNAQEKKKIQRQLKKSDLVDLNERIGHIASILSALDIDDLGDPLAKRWISVATRFHEFAHRHGAWKSPRSKEVFIPLWHEFEDVLAELVGSYFNLLSRVDRILTREQPTKEVIETLPNLLASRARYVYFFRNLKFPAWLKPLRNAGWFNPESISLVHEIVDQRGDYTTSPWYALEYLEKVANLTKDDACEETIDTLVDTINSIVDYANDTGKSLGNDLTDCRVIEIICTLPIERIESRHITFIGIALKSRVAVPLMNAVIGETILPKLLSGGAKELILALLEEMLSAEVVHGDVKAVMEEYWLGNALQAHEQAIAKLCGVKATQIACARIRALINEGAYSFNIVGGIGGKPSDYSHQRYAEILINFTYSLLQSVEFNNDMEEIVRDLLQEGLATNCDDPIKKEAQAVFGRIALNAITHHYENIKHLFWEWKGNPLEELRLKSAIYRLIRTHCFTFDEGEFDRILHWVESYRYGEDWDNDEERLKNEALKKREWLYALMETYNEKVVSVYRRYEQINSVKIERPGLSLHTEISSDKTDLVTVDVLVSMSNAEIAEYLNNFDEDVERSSLIEDNLAQTIVDCVEMNPKRFTDNLLPFRDVRGVYQYWILQGFLAAWRSKKVFDWAGLLEFIYQILSSKQFWTDEDRASFNCTNWVLDVTADLIKSGTSNDKYAFDAQLLPLAEKILLILAKHVKSERSAIANAPITVLNSTSTKVFSALVNYALRSARLRDTEHGDVRWPQAIKVDFTKRLDLPVESSFEFFFTLGAYLPNLLYLDRKWVIDNINRIFSQQDEHHWQAAFSGYLVSSHNIYKDLYFSLKENGHYRKALHTDFDSRDVEALVAHICVGWVEDWETLHDETSLIYQLISSSKPNFLASVVNFFWQQKEMLSDKVKSKIESTWRALFQILSQNSDESEYQKVLGGLSRWLIFIERIEEEVLAWLKLSAKYSNRDSGFNVQFFVEALLEHVRKTPKEVGILYLEMLTNNVYPDYPRDQIQETVFLLYSHGHKAIADRICDLYGEAGFDFLRPLYEEHRIDYTPVPEEQAAARLAQVSARNKRLKPLIEKALGKPNPDVESLTAEEIQQLLLEEGIKPEDNLGSRAIIEEREK